MVKIRFIADSSQKHDYSEVIFTMCVVTEFFSDVRPHR